MAERDLCLRMYFMCVNLIYVYACVCICVCMKHVGVCVKSLEVGPLGNCLSECLSACLSTIQPSQTSPVYNISKYRKFEFAVRVTSLRLRSHSLSIIKFLADQHSLPQSQTQTSCRTHAPPPLVLLLSQNMTFFLSPLPSPEFLGSGLE